MTEGSLITDVRELSARASVIDLKGDVTASSEKALADAYTRASGKFTRTIVLNFSGLEYMNSGGIGMLVTLLVRANRQRQRLERLKTAVGEATMNAIEHGNGNRPELPVEVTVTTDDTDLKVRITDQGGDRGALPDVETPDLEAKLEGLQTPRGWGLFLIQNMVDRLETAVNEHHHTIELVMHLKEEPDARS